MPLVKVQAAYPAAALRRNLEGYVLIEFDVNRAGNVENARVVESSHSVFEQPALTAAEKFRYRPRVVNGTPVRVTGFRNVVRFELEPATR